MRIYKILAVIEDVIFIGFEEGWHYFLCIERYFQKSSTNKTCTDFFPT